MAYTTPNKMGGGRVSSGAGKGKGKDKEKPEPNDPVTNTELMKGVAIAAGGVAEHQGQLVTKLAEKTYNKVKGLFATEERDRNKNKNPDVFEAKRIKNAKKK